MKLENVLIVKVLPEVSIGQHRKVDFVVKTKNSNNFDSELCITAWNQKIDTDIIYVDNCVNVTFDIESKDVNGRYFTNVKMVDICSVVSSHNNNNNNQVEEVAEQEVEQVDYQQPDYDSETAPF